jgi:hypothetical protein
MTGVARGCANGRVGLQFVTGGGDGKGVGGFASACASSNNFQPTNKQRWRCQKKRNTKLCTVKGKGKRKSEGQLGCKQAQQVSKPHS